MFPVLSGDRGGTGRRAGLRILWGNPWGFDSLRSHITPMLVTRTYLELTDRTQFKPAFGVFPRLTIRREEAPTPVLYNRLYRGVGKDYHWRDRLQWTDAQTSEHLAQPHISLHVARDGND